MEVAQYTYTTPSSLAAVSNSLLFVTTAGQAGGIDVYTIRNALTTPAEIGNSPDISMLCSKRLFGPVNIDVLGRDVAVIVKQVGGGSAAIDRALQSGCTGAGCVLGCGFGLKATV